MQLKKWLKQEEKSPTAFGASIGVEYLSIYRWVNGKNIPSHAYMKDIFKKTNGAVTPNDFHGIGPTP